MHRVETKNLNRKVKEAGEYLKNSGLLSKVSTGDLIAKDTMYHLRCLNKLYKDYDQQKKEDANRIDDTNEADLVFAELCVHIQSFSDVNGWYISLEDVCKLYNEAARRGKYNLAAAHGTRLKQKLLASIPLLIKIKSGRTNI